MKGSDVMGVSVGVRRLKLGEGRVCCGGGVGVLE